MLIDLMNEAGNMLNMRIKNYILPTNRCGTRVLLDRKQYSCPVMDFQPSGRNVERTPYHCDSIGDN